MKTALKFLKWFCREDYLDEIEGNIIEIFEKESEEDPSRARRNLVMNVIRHFRPEYIKLFHSKKSTSSANTAMIFNYIKLAFRNLRKKASYSFINIFGLALGVCAALLILNYMDFETSYDSFHVNADRLYRVKRTFIQNNEPGQPNVMTTFGLGPTLVTDNPQFERYIRTHWGSCVVTYQPANGRAISFHEDQMLMADSTFFDAFTFIPLAGDLSTALDNSNNIVLTESTWHKYFGYDDAIGKTLQLAGGRVDGLYTVAAIIKDVPDNSHFNFDLITPMQNIFLGNQYKEDDGWAWNNFSTYVELNNADNYQAAEEKLPDFAKRWMNPRWTSINGRVELHLQPLLKIHNETGVRHDAETVGRSTIYFFGIIALFILFIAWINYINLSTARAMERSREVGIKKTIGAVRGQLITQFLFESIVINVIAVAIAIMLALLLLPVLSSMLGKELPTHLTDIRLYAVLIALFTIGTFASGIYPAFVLSSFKITKAIKPQGERGFSLRKGLVVFQFVSSLVLIAGTFAVYRQITYMQSQDTGLQMDQMVIIDAPGTLKWDDAKKNLEAYKEEAKKIPGVESIATSGAVPAGGYNWGADIRRVGEPENLNTGVSIVYVDPDFITTYNIKLTSGNNYRPESVTDMKSVVINEAALKALRLGTAEEAITQRLLIDDDSLNILAVTKNFNWNSLRSDFTPFVFMPEKVFPVKISVHLQGGSIPATVEALDKLYRDLMPNDPFQYRFLDDSFNSQYKADQQFGKIFGMFAGLAIAICCLGLWGLASFTTSQRLKEIGIRKVLGAPVGSIITLLVRQFMILIGIAALIAIPISWYGVDSWLSGFAFHIPLEWGLFVIPILILTAIALLTVGMQVRRGVMSNPVDVLKSE
jgi:putative ABC transport system permease protein